MKNPIPFKVTTTFYPLKEGDIILRSEAASGLSHQGRPMPNLLLRLRSVKAKLAMVSR